MDTFSVLTGPLASIKDPVTQGNPWRVFLASGEEALSQLFSFSLSLGVRRSALDLALAEIEAIEHVLLRAQVRFRIGELGLERFGIVAAVHDEGAEEVGGEPFVRLRVEIVPRAWLLRHRRNSRIFQGKYIHEIVSEVLRQAGVPHRWSLGKTYPKRIYCTQYDETDYELVTRLFAEEGILFFFEPRHDAELAVEAPPVPPKELSGWDKAVGVVGAVGSAGPGVGGFLGGKWGDWIKTGGTAANIVADGLKDPPKDEEADDPVVIGSGTAGPQGPGDVLVFVDQAGSYPEVPHTDGDLSVLTVTLRDPAQLVDSAHDIVELTPTQRVRTDHVEMRDYDFRRPMLALEARAATADPTQAVPLEAYDHHGEYETPEVTAQLAQVELEQHRADVLLCTGQGPCPRFLPGHVFEAKNVLSSKPPNRRYAVVRVRHESTDHSLAGASASPELDALVRGVAQAISMASGAGAEMSEPELRRLLQRTVASSPGDRPYWTRFECVPSDVARRPPRPARAPRHVTEVATVVGPPGQDIYTDKYGRIKIQFHWDRVGQWKENSSCWVRVVQPWAGTGFGFQFIPRVGMDVLVTFLSGDPDRPVVIGSLYNATHATPEPLPQRATRSGIRTQTTPGGGGFNELSFEDQAGVERIHLHAQKDLHEIVNDTHSSTIKNKQVLTIGNLMEVGVGGDQRWAVGGNVSETVGKDAFVRVGGNQTSDVYGNRTDRVHGSALCSIAGMAFREVKTDDASVVEGNYNLSVHGDMITHVGGGSSCSKSSAVTYVQGSSILTATDRVLIKAEKSDGANSSVRLECGESYLEIGPERITLHSKEIAIRADKTASLRGSDAALALGPGGAALRASLIALQTPEGAELVLDAGSATLTGPSGAVVQGGTVNLCMVQRRGPGGLRLESDHPEVHLPNLKLRFSHLRKADDWILRNTRYRIVAEDRVIEGTLRDENEGRISVWVPDSVRVVYVVLWANESYPKLYPLEEGPLHWLLRIEREMAAATTLGGARVRLRNLGYEPGTKLDEEAVDAPTRAALLEFQTDQDLPSTGELDAATHQKISSTYGS